MFDYTNKLVEDYEDENENKDTYEYLVMEYVQDLNNKKTWHRYKSEEDTFSLLTQARDDLDDLVHDLSLGGIYHHPKTGQAFKVIDHKWDEDVDKQIFKCTFTLDGGYQMYYKIKKRVLPKDFVLIQTFEDPDDGVSKQVIGRYYTREQARQKEKDSYDNVFNNWNNIIRHRELPDQSFITCIKQYRDGSKAYLTWTWEVKNNPIDQDLKKMYVDLDGTENWW